MIHLRLYVTGHTPTAQQARATFEALRQDFTTEAARFEVIDVLEDPVAALNDDVYTTPTIFRLSPEPVIRLFGDFTSKTALARALALR